MMNPVFDLDPDLIYLNHAAVAPWPRVVADAVRDFATENARHGAERYPQWAARETRLREQLAGLLNASSSDDIALVKNTSEALSFVAAGIDWQPGDEIVGIADDFPSNRIPWQALASRGVTYRMVDIVDAEDPEAALIGAMTPATRLLAVSSVHYSTGLRLDLARLGAECRARGMLFCVDAIQSLGLLPFDVQQCGADFVAADGHKWLLSPEGLGVFYVREAIRDQIRPSQFGWRMVSNPADFSATDWTPAASGRRFECGSPNMLGIHALSASLTLIDDIGVEQIFNQIDKLISYLIERSKEYGLNPGQYRPDPARRSGIITLAVDPHRAPDIWRTLMDQRIVTAARGAGIRFSPHLHNTEAQIDEALAALAAAQ